MERAAASSGSEVDVFSSAAFTRAFERSCASLEAPAPQKHRPVQKRKQLHAAAVPAAAAAAARPSPFSQMVSMRRLRNDLADLHSTEGMGRLGSRDFRTEGFTEPVVVPQPHNARAPAELAFAWTMVPQKGFYQGMLLRFQVNVPPMYPHKAPRVRCLTPIFHPNIDPATGQVYLAILATSWRPVLAIYDIVVALQMILLEPNATRAHCVNDEAWRLFRQSGAEKLLPPSPQAGGRRACRGAGGGVGGGSAQPLFHAKVIEHSQRILSERGGFDHGANAPPSGGSDEVSTKRRRNQLQSAATRAEADGAVAAFLSVENWGPAAAAASATVDSTKRKLPALFEMTHKVMRLEAEHEPRGELVPSPLDHLAGVTPPAPPGDRRHHTGTGFDLFGAQRHGCGGGGGGGGGDAWP